MGVRLYNPLTGRFLQVDPVVGGNANAYDYCTGDPINCTDLDGRWGWRSVLKWTALAGAVVGAVACGASIVCGIAVGAVTAAVSYVATNARTNNWSWIDFGFTAVFSGLVGAAEVQTNPGSFAGQGREIKFSKNFRVAPFGNRTGHRLGRYPHYHRRRIDSRTGETRHGQGVGRHRPWESKKGDKSWWSRW
ncbi:RHS repeat-associated core domain-containing protein [Frankia sp. CiP3]|uniref:RHS repeat-associated core domain-containing protein n=1 Tax=Frankia sp. CiP3 TaxID=2880971 RepID=UPI001EF74E04|nr:RHS repeat-associated core domain-containing protein [Frankia sp. CiP3]